MGLLDGRVSDDGADDLALEVEKGTKTKAVLGSHPGFRWQMPGENLVKH